MRKFLRRKWHVYQTYRKYRKAIALIQDQVCGAQKLEKLYREFPAGWYAFRFSVSSFILGAAALIESYEKTAEAAHLFAENHHGPSQGE